MKPARRQLGHWLVLAAATVALSVVAVLLLRRPATAPAANQPNSVITDQTLKLELVPWGRGLSQPTAIVATRQTKDSRLFVVERTGKIRIVGDNGQVAPQPFLDISDRVGTDGSERGLLGLVFHPKYPDNGYFYVNYTDRRGHTHIARFTGRGDQADAGSEKLILQVEQPYANHNAGDLAFGPADGYLYVPLGDGGSAGDPQNRAQNPASLLGKLLRLDVDGGDPYRIPADNPLAGSRLGRPGGRPEIWALGLRNPWRISFDRKTNDLYIGDVGQNKYEEVNFQPAGSKGGENYGWRCYEAGEAFKTDGCGPADKYVAPVAAYRLYEQDKCSLTGGYVYRGQRYQQLQGRYFYGDYCGGQLFSLVQEANGQWRSRQQLDTDLAISSFGEDSSGELYVADYQGGVIYRLQAAD